VKVAVLPYLEVKVAALPYPKVNVAALPYLQHFRLETSMLQPAQVASLKFLPLCTHVHGDEPVPGLVSWGWATQHGDVPVHKHLCAAPSSPIHTTHIDP